MSDPIQKSDSFRKILLQRSVTFDEARYYNSQQTEMGGHDIFEDLKREEYGEVIDVISAPKNTKKKSNFSSSK